MNDPSGVGYAIPEGMDVCHHVVAESCFVLRRGFEIDVVEGGSEGFDLGGLDREPQISLGFRQCQPDASPVPEFATTGENTPHVD